MSTNPTHIGTSPWSRSRRVCLLLAILLGLSLPATGRATWLTDENQKGRIITPPPVHSAAPWQSDYDARNYTLTLDIDFDRLLITGTMTLWGETLTPNFGQLVLNLTDSLTVTNVRRAGNTLSFTHADDLLTISLDLIFQPPDLWSVTVDYEGHPPTGGFLGFDFSEHDGHPIASSLSQPVHAHNWWPCKDVIDDKAFVNLSITVPDTMIAVSNGKPLGTSVPSPGRLTFGWQESNPIAVYLVSLTATNYVTWQENYITAASDTMPVHYYAYPEKQTEAEQDWSITVPVLSMFAGAFGEEYPFLDEKFGMAMFESGASMEHQTCTSYASHLVTGDHQYDAVAVHEISHQWWGNLVTPAEWNDIWLSEGFATWSEAHWAELSLGTVAYRNYMRSLDTGFFQGPIYAPDYLFSRTVYKKGAWVVHMLRRVMGDAAFFQLLQAWAGPPNAYGNASTADLVTLATITHGASLNYFFDQWVYDVGRPLYEYWWQSTDLGGSYDVELRIKQVQITGPIFRLPIDIGIEVASGDTLLFVADNSQEIETFHFEVAEEPVALHFDPFGWILKGAAQVDVTSPPAPIVRLALFPPHPNPAPTGGTTLTYTLPGPGAVRLSVYDPTGRLVTTIDEGWRPAGTHHHRWDGRNLRGRQTASGIYFLRLDSGSSQLHRRLVIVR